MSAIHQQIQDAINRFDMEGARKLLAEALKDPDLETYRLGARVAIDDEQRTYFLKKVEELQARQKKQATPAKYTTTKTTPKQTAGSASPLDNFLQSSGAQASTSAKPTQTTSSHKSNAVTAYKQSVAEQATSTNQQSWTGDEKLSHRFMRTLIPGIGFGMAFFIVSEFVVDSIGLYITSTMLMIAVVLGMGAGIGMNLFGVGFAKRYDKGFMSRLILPAIVTVPVWYFAFDRMEMWLEVLRLPRNDINVADLPFVYQILSDILWMGTQEAIALFASLVVLFVASILIPPIITRNNFAQAIIRFAMMSTMFGLWFAQANLTMNLRQTVAPDTETLIMATLIYSGLITGSLWLAEKLFPQQSGRVQSSAPLPVTASPFAKAYEKFEQESAQTSYKKSSKPATPQTSYRKSPERAQTQAVTKRPSAKPISTVSSPQTAYAQAAVEAGVVTVTDNKSNEMPIHNSAYRNWVTDTGATIVAKYEENSDYWGNIKANLKITVDDVVVTEKKVNIQSANETFDLDLSNVPNKVVYPTYTITFKVNKFEALNYSKSVDLELRQDETLIQPLDTANHWTKLEVGGFYKTIITWAIIFVALGAFFTMMTNEQWFDEFGMNASGVFWSLAVIITSYGFLWECKNIILGLADKDSTGTYVTVALFSTVIWGGLAYYSGNFMWQNYQPWVEVGGVWVAIFVGIIFLLAIIGSASNSVSKMSPEEKKAAGTAAFGILAILGTILAVFAMSQSKSNQRSTPNYAKPVPKPKPKPTPRPQPRRNNYVPPVKPEPPRNTGLPRGQDIETIIKKIPDKDW